MNVQRVLTELEIALDDLIFSLKKKGQEEYEELMDKAVEMREIVVKLLTKGEDEK